VTIIKKKKISMQSRGHLPVKRRPCRLNEKSWFRNVPIQKKGPKEGKTSFPAPSAEIEGRRLVKGRKKSIHFSLPQGSNSTGKKGNDLTKKGTRRTLPNKPNGKYTP